MSWVGIANNQTVSFSNLQDAITNGYFIQKASFSSTSEQITKSDADAKVYLDTGYAPFAGKSNNQLVVKSNLRPVSYSYTIYYNEVCYWDGIATQAGAGTAGAACNNISSLTVYSPSSSFVAGMKLFSDSICSNPWYGGIAGCGTYYKTFISGTKYTFTYPDNGSTVSNINACGSCTCFVLTNLEDIDISIQFYDCQSGQVCNVCPANSSIYLCVQDGQHTNYTVHAGTGCTGSLPNYSFTTLGQSCTDSSSCL